MDPIDRQDAVRIVDNIDTWQAGWRDNAIESLKALPSAQPERKTGRWLLISPAGIYECSECAQMVMPEDISCYKFCHGCGAYMGGDEGV